MDAHYSNREFQCFIAYHGNNHTSNIFTEAQLHSVLQNDLALIELKGEASPDRTVSPACVNSNLTEVIKYESCAALGWGKANESSDFSQDLTTIPLNMLT